jgi:hypothetical protein
VETTRVKESIMGEAKFVEYSVNSVQDVEVAKAGEGYVQAVGELVAAVEAGDLPAAGLAKAKIGQYADCLEGLGQAILKVNQFAEAPAPIED